MKLNLKRGVAPNVSGNPIINFKTVRGSVDMIEEVLPNLFRLEVPLPNNPLKAINSYIIKSKDRNLIIDTGMNREECMAVFEVGLKELSINLRETDFFITHMHDDHSGLVSELATNDSRIYCSLPDSVLIGPVITAEELYSKMFEIAGLCGFPESEFWDAVLTYPDFKYSDREALEFNILKEGDTLSIGEYHFTCLETPGHSDGHLCLYDGDKKLLVSGDHILSDITPSILMWSPLGNPLKDFINSLDRISGLAVDMVLPGHRRVFSDCKGRIEELKLHHRNRAQEILAILEKGAADVYQVASQMAWDHTYRSWVMFPAPQKLFAVGEARSHIRYLEEENLVKGELVNGKLFYSALWGTGYVPGEVL